MSIKKAKLKFGSGRRSEENSIVGFGRKMLFAYENAKIYKERAKLWHDKKIRQKWFYPGQSVLSISYLLRLFPDKLKSRWSGPFKVTQSFSHGAIEMQGKDGTLFNVNGQRLKHYLGEEKEVACSIMLK